jgi:class 3 adenylate cyclase/tetratricopeptide (TPR) repeat protein
MDCEECRAPNSGDANYCHQCGRRLKPRGCPECGSEIQPGARFCKHCGDRLLQHTRSQRNNQPFTERRVAQTPRISFDTTDAERKFVTVLFVDAAGYTAMADRMDPEDVHQIIGACFQILTDLIRRSDGVVTVFSGDGMMALFGAPVAREDHAQRACHAALFMQRAMAVYAKDVQERYGVDLSVRIGISSGTAITGTMGHGYTAIGDTVNVGSRLQSRAEPGTVVVSKETYRLARNFFSFEALGLARVKGKNREIEAYRLIEPIEEGARPGNGNTGEAMTFVGRETELDRLRHAFERTQSGTGQVVALVGEAGVGKSRLLRQFRAGLPSSNLTYLEGECLHFGSPIAYLPMLGILRSYFGITLGVGELAVKKQIDEKLKERGLDRLSMAAPILELFALGGEDQTYLALDPGQRRERIFEALTDLLSRESEERPLVLVVENLLWVDRSTEEFLAYLVPRVADRRILLVLVHRPEYRLPFEGNHHFIRITLGGLDETEGPRIIDCILPGPRVGHQITDFVMGRARGNPLFIEELTHSLKENGYIRQYRGEYVLSEGLVEITVPDSIQGIVTARIDRLPKVARRLLQTAAVIGKTFDLSILQTIVGAETDIHLHLLELQSLEFILPKADRSDSGYEFRHDLIQEVAYNSLLIRRRKEMHEAAGSAIEAAYSKELPEFYGVLAYHYSKSENLPKAYGYLRLSADKATQNSSLWEGFRYYKQALHALQDLPSSPARRREELELYQLMLSPMISIGFPENSLDLLRAGERLARELDSPRHIATFSSMAGLYYSVRGELRQGQRYTEKCYKTAQLTGNIEVLAPTAFDLCSNYAARGEFLRVRQVASKIIPLIEKEQRKGDAFDRGYNIYAALLGFWGFSEGYLGKFEEGEALCNKGLLFCEELQNLYGLGMVETCYGYVLAHKGNGSQAIPHFLKSIRYLEKGHISVLLGLAWSGLGWAHFSAGNLDLAQRHVEKGLSIHSEAGIQYKSSVPHWFLSQILIEKGESEISRKHAEKALDLARENDETYVEGISRILLGVTGMKTDDYSQAEAQLLGGVDTLERLGIMPFSAVGNLYLAHYYRNTARNDLTSQRLAAARAVFESTGMAFWLQKSFTAFPEYR